MSDSTKEYLFTIAACIGVAVVVGLICRDAAAGSFAFPVLILCATLEVVIDIRSHITKEPRP